MITNIQFLRLIAAFMIVVLHLILFGNEKYGLNMPKPASLESILDTGVDIFFVISGFVMVYTTKRKPTNARHFLLNRITRIYPVYWLLIFLTLPVFFLRPDWVNSSSAVPTSLWHSLFLFPHEGSPLVMVAWTLEFEMFFYIVFSLTLFLDHQRQIQAITAIFLMLVLAGLQIQPKPSQAFLELATSPLLLEFVAGMWLGYYYDRIKPSKTIFWISSGLAALSFYYVSLVESMKIERLFHYGFTAFFCVSAALSAEKIKWTLPKKISIISGNISYSLYLLHVLVIAALGRAWLSLGGKEFVPLFILFFCIIIASILGAALLYYFCERPVMKLLRNSLSLGK